MTALNDRLDALALRIARGEIGTPYTGAGTSSWACPSCRAGEHNCKSCDCTCCNGANRAQHPKTPCRTCGEPTRTASRYHHDCEPTTCVCDVPRPDGLGECAGCHRLVLSHSWHNGRPA